MATILLGRDKKTKYELDRELKHGGEGAVYTIQGRPKSVAKVYNQQLIANPQLCEATKNKILAMLDMHYSPYYNGRLLVAWPEDILFDKSGVFQGYVMPKIDNMKSLVWACRPSDRAALWPKGYRWQYSVVIAFNLALTIEHMHDAGIVIGDLNTNNILINAEGDVTLIDAGSFNISTRTGQIYKCIVGFPEVLPPELQGKDLSRPTSQFNEKTDCFSLAVHIFTMLCNNCHPFGCLDYNSIHSSTSQPQIMHNIVKGHCPYVSGSTASTVKDALDMNVFPSEIRTLFDRAFNYDMTTAVQQSTIAKRPSAKEWRIALGNLYNSGFNTCKKETLHEYPKSYTGSCPWCAIQFPHQTTVASTAISQSSTYTPVSNTPSRSSHRVRNFLIFLLIAAILWVVITVGLTKGTAEKGNFERASGYMDLFPFYKDLFPDEYNYIKAANDYRNGRYESAYYKFRSVGISYKDTDVFREFCLAHIKEPSDYFYTIVNNIEFEDARDLLVFDDDIFCKYMEGTWNSAEVNDDKKILMEKENENHYVLHNFPELPGGGTFDVNQGTMLYKYDGYDNWLDFCQLDVKSKKHFYATCLWSGVTYSIRRQ